MQIRENEMICILISFLNLEIYKQLGLFLEQNYSLDTEIVYLSDHSVPTTFRRCGRVYNDGNNEISEC